MESTMTVNLEKGLQKKSTEDWALNIEEAQQMKKDSETKLWYTIIYKFTPTTWWKEYC